MTAAAPITFRTVIGSPSQIAATVMAAIGVGSCLSALTVAYRDFQYVVPFMVQLWMFVTPVIYPLSIVPQEWRWVLSLNPMAGLIYGFRGALLARPLDWLHLWLSLAVSAVLFLVGAAIFCRMERRFADVI